MTPDELERRCNICGAPALPTNPGMCKNFHEMKKEPEEQMYLIGESRLKRFENGGYFEVVLREIRQNPYPAKIPNSTELLAMAHQDWKNREERRGIHAENDWCSGWITGFLTPNKPAWPRTDSQRISELEAANRSLAGENIRLYGVVDENRQQIADARMDLLKELQTFIDDADSREGCPLGTLQVAALVRWMSARGYDCD